MMLVVCDRCGGKGCRHCSNTGLIDCPTCQADTHTVDWRARCLAAEAELAKLRERVADTAREARLIVSQYVGKDAYRQGAAAASKKLLARLEVLP
jgi:uncharacterized Zn finger protein (UPF0148 family)